AKPQRKKSNVATFTINIDAMGFYAEIEMAKAAAKQTADEINETIQKDTKTNAERLMTAFRKKTEVK
ncbi:MAG: hypothetical protein VB112_03260, partial [Oscillospiraceae bacterium]|nr:hypothetical protein [Oscillospiraceae bacterium]